MATDYLNIDADTVPTIVSKYGSNTQEQAWCAKVAIGAPAASQFGPVIENGAGPAKPIKQIFDFSKLHGQVVHFQSRAPLGASPGVQGSAANRVGTGEDAKINVWDMFMGIQFQAGRYNSVALAQTILGQSGNQDTLIQNSLVDLYKGIQGRMIEATMLQRKQTRTTLYCGGKTTIDTLTSSDTFTVAMARTISNTLANNMAEPIVVAKPRSGGVQPLRRFYFTGCSELYDDMEGSSDYINTLSLSRLRGDENELYYGDLPSFSNVVLDRYQIQYDTSDGPKGTLGAPRAFLGEAIIALPVTGYTMKGGGSAAAVTRSAAAASPFLFFENFPGAAFAKFESTKRAATTGTELYLLAKQGSTGKFGMYGYQVTDGNTITLTKALRSTDSTSGKIDVRILGGVTWGTAPWTTAFLTDTNDIGDMVLPCNRLGQPYVTGYGMGNNALWTGYGMFVDGSAMGKRTIIDGKLINHDRESELGLAMNWGCEAQQDANGLQNGYVVVYGAYNIPGMPQI